MKNLIIALLITGTCSAQSWFKEPVPTKDIESTLINYIEHVTEGYGRFTPKGFSLYNHLEEFKETLTIVEIEDIVYEESDLILVKILFYNKSRKRKEVQLFKEMGGYYFPINIILYKSSEKELYKTISEWTGVDSNYIITNMIDFVY